MIIIKLTAAENSFELEMRGHARYRAGNDIVCAACSALACALVGCLERISPDGLRSEFLSGRLSLRCPVTDRNRAAFEMAVTGFRQISEKYPGYVRLCPLDI